LLCIYAFVISSITVSEVSAFVIVTLLEGRREVTTYLYLGQREKYYLFGSHTGSWWKREQNLSPFFPELHRMHWYKSLCFIYFSCRGWFLPRLLWQCRWELQLVLAEGRPRRSSQGTGPGSNVTISVKVHGEAIRVSTCAVQEW